MATSRTVPGSGVKTVSEKPVIDELPPSPEGPPFKAIEVCVSTTVTGAKEALAVSIGEMPLSDTVSVLVGEVQVTPNRPPAHKFVVTVEEPGACVGSERSSSARTTTGSQVKLI